MKVEDILSGGHRRRKWRGPRRGRIKGIEIAPIRLKEGGNVFDDVIPFDHKKIPDIMKAINSVLKQVGAKAIPIGSGATPTPGKVSGDLDMIVDQEEISAATGEGKPANIKKALRALYDQAGFETGQSGVSVHVRVPVGDEAHQVDIMVVPNAAAAAKFHTHNIPKGSPFKGVNKQLAMAHLAKQNNMLWSPYQGLFSRNESGKKGEFITQDPDEVAQHLLGPNASAQDLGSLESMMAALGPQGDQLLADLRADPNWKENR